MKDYDAKGTLVLTNAFSFITRFLSATAPIKKFEKKIIIRKQQT